MAEDSIDEAKEVLLLKQSASGGRIDFNQFLQLLCGPPWSFMLRECEALVEVLSGAGIVMVSNRAKYWVLSSTYCILFEMF